VRENYGLQIRLAFIGKPVRMPGQANELIGCFDEIHRSHSGVLAERHVVLAPDVEGRNANLACGNVEIVVNGAIPIQCRGKGSWLGKPLRSLVNQVFRHARVECSAQPSGSVGEQGRLRRTIAESKEADVVETAILCGIGFTGLLKGDRVRRREHGQRLDPLWMGRCKRPRNHAAPIVSDDMERLRADGVSDSEDIVHETAWTIFSHLERSGTTGIAALVESDGPVSSRAKSFQAIPPPTGELRPAVQEHDDRAALGTAQARVENEIAGR
jgi:hypothetical protein